LDAFNPPRDRDAWAAIRGFVYQVDLTIRRWLDLAPDEALDLECGEDIDLVSAASVFGGNENERLLEQVKHRQEPITLVTGAAVSAIACAVEHRAANPQIRLRFRFTTNARVGKERFSRHSMPAILVWEAIRTNGQATDPASLSVIRDILKSTTKPAKLHDDAWKVFRRLVEQGSDDELLDLIGAFEWGTGTDDAASLATTLRQQLIDSGRARDLHHAQSLYERLFLHVFKTISRAGLKRVTPGDLIGLLALPALSDEDRATLDRVNSTLVDLERRVELGEQRRRRQGLMIERLDGQVQALARQQGVLASIQYVVEDVDLDIPPPCAHFCPRVRAARELAELASRSTWTAIEGASWSGKTQLVASVARSWPRFSGWVRLRELSPAEACHRLDRAMEVVSGIPKAGIRRDWYRQVFCQLGVGSLLVVEDLPRLTSSDALSDRLTGLARSAASAGVRLVTTSCFPLPSAIRSLTGGGMINTLTMPPLREDEARVILRSQGAPESLLTESFVRGTNNLASRHPLLLSAIGGYLSQRSWQFRDQEFDELLSSRHVAEVNRDIIERLLNTVADERSRELLYRLTLIIGSFSTDDVRALASVKPSLDRPRERLHAVTGPWVQSDARGRLVLSPLVDALGSDDVPWPVKRRCLFRLGKRSIRRDAVRPEDLCLAVGYFSRARAYDQAGLLLIQALSHLHNLDHLVDPRGVISLWHGMALPARMDLGIRIYLRALQFLVRSRYRCSTEGLLDEIDRLSQQATDREGWGVLGAAVLLSRRLGDIDRLLGIRLLRRGYELTADFRNYAGNKVEWPEGMGPECLIWGVALDLASEQELAEWLAAVDTLGPEKRLQAFSRPMADAGCMMMGGALYRSEMKQPEPEQNWPRVLEGLDRLAVWARQRGLEVLWACAVRHRLVILGENLREPEAARATAEDALRSASPDPRVRFVLSDSIGEFLLRAGRTDEALTWLEQARVFATDSFVLERLLVLVNASRATAAANPVRSLEYLREAGRLAISREDLPETELARVHGEIAVGEGLAGNLAASFNALDIGVEALLECRDDTNLWKVLFVLFGHSAGYFMSMATRGVPPAKARDGEAYAEPRRGYFYSHDTSIGGMYDGSKDYAIAIQLAFLADALGEDDRAAFWGSKALELARLGGQESVVDELMRRFIPQMILKDRYAEALEASLDHGAVLVARSIEREADRGGVLDPILDVGTVLGDRPNDHWRKAERWAATAGILPAAVRICSLALKAADTALLSAEEVVAACRQIEAQACDPDLWSSIADLFVSGFIRPVPASELKQMADRLPAEATTLRVLTTLFASMQPDITAESALAAHLSVLPCLCEVFDQPLSTHRLILVPFVVDYWNATFRRMRFRFRAPELVQLALSEASAKPPSIRVQAVMRAVLIGIPLRVLPETKVWLDSPDCA